MESPLRSLQITKFWPGQVSFCTPARHPVLQLENSEKRDKSSVFLLAGVEQKVNFFDHPELESKSIQTLPAVEKKRIIRLTR